MNTTEKKILVVEDERPMARALELKLEGSGFTVDTVGDGEEAVERIINGNYDLVLLDIVIPKKDGFKVLKEIREKGSTTPIIITSNLSQEEDEKKALNLGAVGYIIKSNTPLVDVVSKVKINLGIA